MKKKFYIYTAGAALCTLLFCISMFQVITHYASAGKSTNEFCRATLSGRLKRHFIIANFSRKKAQPHLNDTVMPLSLHSLSSMPGY